MTVIDERDTPDSTTPAPAENLPYHFQIVDLRSLVVGDQDTGTPHLHVESLQVLVTRTGLNELIEHLGANSVTIFLSFERPKDGPGVDIVVQGSRWIFKATVRVQLRLHSQSDGVVTVELVPGRSWSPADMTVLTILRKQISEHIKERSEIVEAGPRSFEIDLQDLVNDTLSEGEVPVQWGAMLSDVHADSEEIRFQFTPVSDPVEATASESM
jgi:hypothetical protein